MNRFTPREYAIVRGCGRDFSRGSEAGVGNRYEIC